MQLLYVARIIGKHGKGVNAHDIMQPLGVNPEHIFDKINREKDLSVFLMTNCALTYHVNDLRQRHAERDVECVSAVTRRPNARVIVLHEM